MSQCNGGKTVCFQLNGYPRRNQKIIASSMNLQVQEMILSKYLCRCQILSTKTMLRWNSSRERSFKKTYMLEKTYPDHLQSFSIQFQLIFQLIKWKKISWYFSKPLFHSFCNFVRPLRIVCIIEDMVCLEYFCCAFVQWKEPSKRWRIFLQSIMLIYSIRIKSKRNLTSNQLWSTLFSYIWRTLLRKRNLPLHLLRN